VIDYVGDPINVKKQSIQKRFTYLLSRMVLALYCSDETVHYKSNETVNFCGFRCAATSPITVFIKFVFFTFIVIIAGADLDGV